jgi:hypothetical protein
MLTISETRNTKATTTTQTITAMSSLLIYAIYEERKASNICILFQIFSSAFSLLLARLFSLYYSSLSRRVSPLFFHSSSSSAVPSCCCFSSSSHNYVVVLCNCSTIHTSWFVLLHHCVTALHTRDYHPCEFHSYEAVGPSTSYSYSLLGTGIRT